MMPVLLHVFVYFHFYVCVRNLKFFLCSHAYADLSALSTSSFPLFFIDVINYRMLNVNGEEISVSYLYNISYIILLSI